MFCEHEDGVEGRGLYVVEDIKSYLKGQDMFCIDEDKRVKSTN